MNQLLLRNGQTLRRQSQPMPARKTVLSPAALDHGVYYAGMLGGATGVARWHAKKRRFVFGEYTLGAQRVRSVAHVADQKAAGERFVPLARIEPKDAYRVSDYAFETA
ncbi:MAG TPA: hypothetical protein VML56_12275 [Burkholderiales bacterium]|nr:hypothetical protein [Burkholderiales bacterium]HTS54824.1 hypothetical protein [Burkholderiales bacterium]